MKQFIIFLLALTPFLLFDCKGGKKGTTNTPPIGTSSDQSKVHFTPSNSLFALLDRAEEEEKLVFVDVYTTWCLPCKLMDEQVFTDQKIADFLNENFISYKVDAEKNNGPNIAAVYEVNAYPTLLFMDGKGRVIVKKEGAAMQTEFMELAKRAINNQHDF